MFHALRTPDALIDLGLFKNRTFAVASGTLVLMIVSVFGAMLLLPLYLQAVRGERPSTPACCWPRRASAR